MISPRSRSGEQNAGTDDKAEDQGDSKEEAAGPSPSRLIDEQIKELGDWRGETLARLRTLIKQADPYVVEEWKWRGVPGVVARGNHLHR